MNDILIEGTDDSPEVKLDAERGELAFSGRSLPENVNSFYEPIFQWVCNYVANPKDNTHISFFFEYINSSSSKKILEILMELKKLKDKGKSLNITWQHRTDDDDMFEEGIDFQKMLGFDFHIISR